MTLHLETFGSPWELNAFVVDHAIPQGDIEIIIEADRRWYLFFWE